MSKLETTFDKFVQKKDIHECIAYVQNSNGDVLLNKGYNNKNTESEIILSSITKLYTTACILKLYN